MYFKAIVFLFFMGIDLPGFCQKKIDFNFLKTSQLKWADFEIPYSDSSKRNLIRELKNELKNDPLKDYITDNNADYHVIDVDANGEPDIIYYGFAGEEKNRTLVFLKKRNGYSKDLDIFGEIIGMEKRFPFSPITFKLMNSPCCENIDYSYEEYSYIFKKNELIYQLSYQLKFLRGTVFPACELEGSGKFIVTNQEYNLRSSPEVSDDNTNVVAVYPKGTRGIAFCRKKDEAGRNWWFVIISGNYKPVKTELGNGDYFSCGWMSDRFLDFNRQ